MSRMKSILLLSVSVLCCLFAVQDALYAADEFSEEGYDPMFAVREGWAWPVVVVPPPEGWDSPAGESLKYAMRSAERELSRQRGGIRGKEVVFLFSSVSDTAELMERIRTWRAMGVCAIVSFANDAMNDSLYYICRDSGPSVLFAGGENIRVNNPSTGRPYRYLFALDFSYFARANALAELAASERPGAKVAVITDAMSQKLAKGAELNVVFLKSRGIDVAKISVPAFTHDQFIPQIRDLESGGARLFSVWLDAMATLSIWRTALTNRKGSAVCYAGGRQPILLDAEGLMIVDKDVLLERNESGKRDIITMLRDRFNRIPAEPVLSAKAYALAKWIISAYADSDTVDDVAIAEAMARVGGIPLMDEILSVNPDTHRPLSRKFGVLRVEDRTYKSHGSVEIFSSEVSE